MGSPGYVNYVPANSNPIGELVTIKPLLGNFSNVKDAQKTPLEDLQELCDYPVLYVNYRAANSENQNHDKIFAVTISNKQPAIDKERLEVTYPADAFAVDVFFINETNSIVTGIISHWTSLLCAILTFRGHEVFLNNELFIPFSQTK